MSAFGVVRGLLVLLVVSALAVCGQAAEDSVNPQDWVEKRPAAVVYIPELRELVQKGSDNPVWSHDLVSEIVDFLVESEGRTPLGPPLEREMVGALERLVETLATEADCEVYLFVDTNVPLRQSWTVAISCGGEPADEFEQIFEAADGLLGGMVQVETTGEQRGELTAGGGRVTLAEWVHAQGWLWVFPAGGPGAATAERVAADQPPTEALAKSRRWINAKEDHGARQDADLYGYVDPEAARSYLPFLKPEVWQASGLADLVSLSLAVELDSDDSQGLVEVDLFGRVAVPRKGLWKTLSGSGEIDRVDELPEGLVSASFYKFDSEKLNEELKSIIETAGSNPVIDGMNRELARMGDFTVYDLLEAFDGSFMTAQTFPAPDEYGDFWVQYGVADYEKAEEFLDAYTKRMSRGTAKREDKGDQVEWFGDSLNPNRPAIGIIFTKDDVFFGTRERAADLESARRVPLGKADPVIGDYLGALRSTSEGKLPFVSIHSLQASLERHVRGWVRSAEWQRQHRLQTDRIDLTDFDWKRGDLSLYPTAGPFLEQCWLRLLTAGVDQVEAMAVECYDETHGFRVTFGLYRPAR